MSIGADMLCGDRDWPDIGYWNSMEPVVKIVAKAILKVDAELKKKERSK